MCMYESFLEVPHDQLVMIHEVLKPLIPMVVINGEAAATKVCDEKQRLYNAFHAGRRSVVDDLARTIQANESRVKNG